MCYYRTDDGKCRKFSDDKYTSYCVDGPCPYDTHTNADRIRGMSDEELAEYIFDLGNGSEYCYGHCVFHGNCTTRGLDHDTCIKGVIDWLKQSSETEGTE